MCGILGFAGFDADATEALHSLAHRGPDDYGEYADRKNHVFLGHRRLSILDLSRSGRQPMATDDGCIHITYNGETYNFRALQESFLREVPFRSKTDTEVILQLYRKFGSRTPQYLRGMYAFGIYDKVRGEFLLCRDRIGIKPLFYYEKGNQFAFASELASLKALPGLDLEIDPMALDYYFTYGYIPAPFSAYKYIRKLKRAHLLIYDIRKRSIRTVEPYWRLQDSVTSQPDWTEAQWLAAIEEKIRESIRLHLISDVPLGAFLSGGLDSSLVVSRMAQTLDRPVQTFTIGFENKEYDESRYAESVAKHCATEHLMERVTPDAAAILPQAVWSFGEPFGDPSAIPTYCVAQMARKSVTVVLSGDGGDEVFGGYERYARMHGYAWLRHVPIPLRKLVQHAGSFLPEHIRGYGFLQRQAYDRIRLYHEMHSRFQRAQREQLYTEDFRRALLRDETEFFERLLDEHRGLDDELITQLQIIDLHSYLPEDVLTKVDRMSMLHGLETRVPLLDHELVELVFACPPAIRFKARNLKYLVKRLLAGTVPDDVLAHRKQGFGVPLSHWFRRELRPALAGMAETAVADPVIRAEYVRELAARHQRGGRNFGDALYCILFYQCWRASELGEPSGPGLSHAGSAKTQGTPCAGAPRA
jgi:asparagine synthase (glutamine-hydrolysing)